MHPNNFKFASFYRFVKIQDCEAIKSRVSEIARKFDLKGTVLLASEGINGMLAGVAENLESVIEELKHMSLITGEELKFSYHHTEPFKKLKVKIKKEIVTFGKPVDAVSSTGIEVEPAAWNNLIEQNDVFLLDCRNNFEYEYGTFEGAVNPQTEKFSEMVEYTDNLLSAKKGMKIAMFCTGGIRCEKYSSYLLSLGFGEVYQLKGGILRYLEQVNPSKSKWRGDCFIFDERRALNHNLEATE